LRFVDVVEAALRATGRAGQFEARRYFAKTVVEGRVAAELIRAYTACGNRFESLLIAKAEASRKQGVVT